MLGKQKEMSEAKVGLLFKAATIVSNGRENHVNNILKSYYLLKCSEATKGYGLPQKQFSKTSRCSHCFLEWNNNFDCKIVPLKLSKRQRIRIRKRNEKEGKKTEEIIHGNKMEQICYFCKQITYTYLSKSNSEVQKFTKQSKNITLKEIITTKEEKPFKSSKSLQNVSDVYCNAKEVFSLKNNKNTLMNTRTENPKIIKNNKKRKDKFAGLCQKAVLSAAKLKDKDFAAKSISDKDLMKLFLKPAQ